MPFAFIPRFGSGDGPKPGPPPTRVRALPDRIEREITFPRLMGYRYDLPETKLDVKFPAESRLTLSSRDLPMRTENAPIIGEAGAGQRSAIIYTVIESCRRRGIDPYGYLRDILTRLPHLTNRQIPEVTPEAWAKARRPATKAS